MRKKLLEGRASKDAGERPVLSHRQVDIDEARFPELTDLIGRLRFSTKDGRITMEEHRMLLVHAKAFGSFRRELIQTFGIEVARGLLTRMGYQAGAYDAQMARVVRSRATLEEMFFVGPQMHCLEGIGLSEVVRLEIDVEKGIHYGEFVWTQPVEDEEHLKYFPVGEEPACWMQIGYASGYASEFMGKPILYREVECQAMGQSICRIIGRPVEEWGEEGAYDLGFVMPVSGEVEIGVGAIKRPVPMVKLAQPKEEAGESSGVVGLSPGFQSVMHMVRRVAPTNATVLLLGESGVGKEVFAKTVHRLSKRSDKPFVAVNCAAIPEHLAESELFGNVRGAFTGATHDRPGRFERADGGTLFLDEIGTLSLETQGNLLRALQNGEIERLGDTQSRNVDVRLIAATNVDLRGEVIAGRFREDLFFRLNVFPVVVPPLRERREDVPLLVNHFLRMYNKRHDRNLKGFTHRAIDAIMSYDWPGNVRELENVIERGVILAGEHEAIDTADLFTSGEAFDSQRFAIGPNGNLVPCEFPHLDGADSIDQESERAYRSINNLLSGLHDGNDPISFDEIERVLLKKALDHAKGNIAAAARVLGMTRPQMEYRLKSRGIVDNKK